MLRSPRFWLIVGLVAATLHFWMVGRADAFIGFWQMFDFFDWMR